MSFSVAEIDSIRFKRRLYLLFYCLAIAANFGAIFYHPAFIFVQIAFVIAFTWQFLSAADSAGFSDALQYTVVGLTAASILLRIPLFGLITFVIVLVVDHKLYRVIKDAS